MVELGQASWSFQIIFSFHSDKRYSNALIDCHCTMSLCCGPFSFLKQVKKPKSDDSREGHVQRRQSRGRRARRREREGKGKEEIIETKERSNQSVSENNNASNEMIDDFSKKKSQQVFTN